MFRFVLVAATLKRGDDLPASQSVAQTMSQEKRGYEALNKMMDNVEAIQAKTKAELAAMEKTDFFKLPAKPSSFLESDLKGSHLRRFDAEKEEKDLADLGRKFQAQLAAIHGVKPSSFAETATDDEGDEDLDDSMAKVKEEMKAFSKIVEDQKKQVGVSKQWAAKMHKELAADRDRDKAAIAAMGGKPSSFVEVSSDGKTMPTIPDVAVFDPNKKYDISAMKEKLEQDQDAVQDAKQKFEDAMDSWKNDKLQKLSFEDDDDDAGVSSFLETGEVSEDGVQQVEKGIQRNEQALRKLSKFVQTPFFHSVQKYADQPISSLLENGHTAEQVADMRGLVHSLKHAPKMEELDGDMAQAQAKLTKVQTQVDAELTALQSKLEAQAKQRGISTSLLEERSGTGYKFKESADLLAEKEDLLKTKAITAELHKKTLASRARLQEDFKHMNVKFHHDPGFESLMQHMTQMHSGETQTDQDSEGENSDDSSFVQTKDLRTH